MPDTHDNDPWQTVAEISDYLHVHPATTRRAIAAGKLRHARVGGRLIRIRRSWGDAWLENNATPSEVAGARR